MSPTIPYRKVHSRDDDLVRRQQEHLRNVRERAREPDQESCTHNRCTDCIGTMIRTDGSRCPNHAMLYCPCKRCNPYTHRHAS